MLKNDREMDPAWKTRLDMIFGDSGWYDEFYKIDPQTELFESKDRYYKDINTEAFRDYICKRLKTIFPAVAANPRILYNKKNSPLFLFCFAVSNNSKKAIGLALNGANHILNYKMP
jgi:hypothetical protein